MLEADVKTASDPESTGAPVLPPRNTAPVLPPRTTTHVLPPRNTTPVIPPRNTTPDLPPRTTAPVIPPQNHSLAWFTDKTNAECLRAVNDGVDGTFVVRMGTTRKCFELCVKDDGHAINLPIEHAPDGYHFDERVFPSVNDVVATFLDSPYLAESGEMVTLGTPIPGCFVFVEVEYPPPAEFWIEDAGVNGNEEFRRDQAQKVIPWLIYCITNAHSDRNIKHAAMRLITVRSFTVSLHFLHCWHPLRAGLTAQLHTLGSQLHNRYDELDLGNVLSNERIGCDNLRYHSLLSDKRQKYNTQLTHSDLLPGLGLDNNLFDFSGDHLEIMDERVLLIVILMISKAVDAMFQKKTQKIVRKCNNTIVRGAPIKQYARSLNKAFSDHIGKQLPRTAYNVDTVRALLMVPDPNTVIEAVQLLVQGFDGVAKFKNLFALTEDERAARFHLLTFMLTVVVNSGMTFSEMAKDPQCQQLFDAFAADIPHSEPKERWERMYKRARDYLSHPSIANETVYTYGEIQIILAPDALVRKEMHLAYKVIRAETASQLYADFLQSYGNRPCEVTADTLYAAALRGQLSVVAALLDGGANVDERLDCGRTPLHLAAQWNHPDVAQLLIDRGASVNKSTNAGHTPVSCAVQHNLLHMTKLLISNNAAIDQADNGNTPVYLASQSNRLEVVNLLISSNAALDQVSDTGRAPLNVAASRGHLETVKVLVGAGANMNVKGNWGTPLKEAIDSNMANVAEYLRHHGAKVE